MLHVDLSRLVSKRNCTIPYTLFRNRYQILTSTLADLKINAFTLINTKCIIKLTDFLNTPLEKLPILIFIYRYNG